MKQSFAIGILWLTTTLLISAAETPLVVGLNGIVNFSGFNCAFFVLNQPGSSALRNFMLAQGESRFGIKLAVFRLKIADRNSPCASAPRRI
jgi:hypothetical protein